MDIIRHREGGFFPDISGKKHPLYGRKRTIEERIKISENHADTSGSHNIKAKITIFTSPTGSSYKVIGERQVFCKEMGLSYATLKRFFKTKQMPQFGALAGWKIMVLDTDDKTIPLFKPSGITNKVIPARCPGIKDKRTYTLKKGEDIFIGTRSDFLKLVDMPSCALSQAIRGYRIKGWRFICRN